VLHFDFITRARLNYALLVTPHLFCDERAVISMNGGAARQQAPRTPCGQGMAGAEYSMTRP
jgi:hypothetical protein